MEAEDCDINTDIQELVAWQYYEISEDAAEGMQCSLWWCQSRNASQTAEKR